MYVCYFITRLSGTGSFAITHIIRRMYLCSFHPLNCYPEKFMYGSWSRVYRVNTSCYMYVNKRKKASITTAYTTHPLLLFQIIPNTTTSPPPLPLREEFLYQFITFCNLFSFFAILDTITMYDYNCSAMIPRLLLYRFIECFSTKWGNLWVTAC